MTSHGTTEGRSIKKIAAVGATLTLACTSLLLLTGFPPGLASGAGASTALAELAARSPGARIGGVALKAKTKRPAPVALTRGAAPAGIGTSPGLGTPIASVMSAGPEGPLGAAPTGLGALPGGLTIPATAAEPAPGVVSPVPGGGVGFVPVPGGGMIIGPGGGGPGGGGPGGGGAITPTPTPTPTPTVTPPAIVPTPTPTPTTPPVAAIPEPGTWLMLIVGFGLVGRTLRRRRLALRLI